MIDLQAEFVSHMLGDGYPFRELVTYTPSGSSARDIYAIVKRNGTRKTSGSKGAMDASYDYEIVVSTSDTDGVANVKTREDKVTISAPEFGADATNSFRVAAVISKTEMSWHLGLTA